MLCTRGLCSSFLLLAAVLVGAPSLAHSQTSRISGVVRDSSGVPREGATVRATNGVTALGIRCENELITVNLPAWSLYAA